MTVTPPAGRPQKAGDVVQWTVTVENRGDAPFRRLRAWTVDEKNFFLDRREFVFGTIRPGERRSWVVPLKLPRSFDSRRDEVTLHFEDDQGKAPADVLTSLDVVETARPALRLQPAGGRPQGRQRRRPAGARRDLHGPPRRPQRRLRRRAATRPS